MTKKGIINHKMKEAGNTEARKEQIKLNKIIRSIFFDSEVRMEYKVYSDGVLVANIDVAVVDKRIAYRIMGKSHAINDPDDIEQRVRLERLGWLVHDIWWDISPELWEND